MTHDEALLQAVLDNPDDDAPRLVYADYLDEHGDADRAEFIRVQCELARMAEGDERRWELEVRQKLLLYWHGKGWAGPLRRLVRRWQFRRGFVEAVTLPADAFFHHADELFELTPLQHVRLLHAEGHLAGLADCPHLARLRGLDLRHTPGLDPERMAGLLASPHLRGLRFLGLRGTGMCSGPGLWALAACRNLAGLTALDLCDHRCDPDAGRDQVLQGQSWHQRQSWRQGAEARPLWAGAMRALTESPYLTGLRALGLGGYGQAFHREALDRLLGSRLLSGLEELDLSLDFVGAGHYGGQHYQGQPDLLDLLARSPAAARLRTLRLRRVGTYYHPWESLPGSSHLAGLTTLELDDAFPSPEWLQELADGALPNLVTLRMRGSRLVNWAGDDGRGLAALLAGATGMPRLAMLDLHQTAFSPEAARVLAEGPLLAGLRWLSLANRSGCGSSPIGTEAVQILASSPRAARLVHLDLSNNDLGDDAARSLAASPHLARLMSLNVWHNYIGPAGAAALAAMPALAALDLRANPLPPAACRQLRARLGPGVRYGPGRLLAGDKWPIPGPPPPPGADDDIPF